MSLILPLPQLRPPLLALQIRLQLEPVPRRHQCLSDMVERGRLPILARFVQAGQELLVHGVDAGGEVTHPRPPRCPAPIRAPRGYVARPAGARSRAARRTPQTGAAVP